MGESSADNGMNLKNNEKQQVQNRGGGKRWEKEADYGLWPRIYSLHRKEMKGFT